MIRSLIYLAVFLTPLIFNFSTRELFEFPKILFIYAVAATTLAASLFLLNRGHSSASSPKLTRAWIVLFLISLIATIFSLDVNTSIFGYYTRFNGGLLSLSSFAVLYFFTVKELDKETMRESLLWLTAGSTIVGLYAIGQNLGLDKNFWVQDSQARAFSTLGQPNWLAAYLLMTAPISVYLLLTTGTGGGRLFFLLSTVVSFGGIWFTYSLSGFLGLIAAVTVFVLLSGREILQKKTGLLTLLAGICLTIAVLRPGSFGVRIYSAYKNLTARLEVLAANDLTQTPKEIDTSVIRTTVWRGALRLFISSPKIFLIGAGPETFAYAFLPFRPVALNQTTEWDFLYNKSHNYYLDLLTGSGVLGLIAYLYFTFSILNLGRKTRHHDRLFTAAILSGTISLGITNFFGWPTVSTSLLFFLYPAFLEKISAVEKKPTRPLAQTDKPNRLTVFVSLSLLIVGLKTIGDLFLADVHFSRAAALAKKGLLAEAHKEFSAAVKRNPLEPTYHREFAYNLAQEALNATDPNDQSLLAVTAAEHGETAAALNPRNSLTLKSLLRTYFALAKISPIFEKKVEGYAREVTALAPTEPRAYFDAALILSYLQKNKAALAYAQKAEELKPDYDEAKALVSQLQKTEETFKD